VLIGSVAVVGIGLAAVFMGEDPEASTSSAQVGSTGSNARERPGVLRSGSMGVASDRAVPLDGRSMFNVANIPPPRFGQRPDGSLRAAEPDRVSENATRRPRRPEPAEPSVRPIPSDNATVTTGGVESSALEDRRRRQEEARQRATEAEARRREMEASRVARLQEAQMRAELANRAAAARQQRPIAPQIAASTENPANAEGQSPRDPNAPPTIEEIMAMLPNGGRGSTTTGSGSSSGGGGGGGSGSGSGSGSGGSGSGSSGSGSSGSGSGGGGGGDGGGGPTTTTGNGSTAVVPSLRWIPVDNRACGATLAGHRTNDLYLRLSASAPVVTVGSNATTGLAVTGGAFFNVAGAGNVLPVGAATDPCRAFDSALNDFGLIEPESAALRIDTRLVASWFDFDGATLQQSAAQFGDNGFYLRIGRFTAPVSITGMSGALAVGIGTVGVNFQQFTITVPFPTELWTDNPDFNLPPSTGSGDGDDDGDDDGSGNGGGGSGGGGSGGGGSGGGDNGGGGGGSGGGGSGGGGGGGGGDGGGGGGGSDDGDDDDDPPVDNECPGTPGTPFPAPPYAEGDVIAVWLPIDNCGCKDEISDGQGGTMVVSDLSEIATADLYIRMSSAARLQFVVSADDVNPPAARALRVTGGEFFQHAFGDRIKPTAQVIEQAPCVAFDSFLALDTPQTAAGVTPSIFQLFWTATAVEGLWVVPGFSAATAEPARQDAVRFPGDPTGYYIRVARFSVDRGATISGFVDLGIVPVGTGQTMNLTIPIPACAECFAPSGN